MIPIYLKEERSSILVFEFDVSYVSGGIYPAEAVVLYEPGAIFDKNYNSHFKPYKFILPQDTVKVIYRNDPKFRLRYRGSYIYYVHVLLNLLNKLGER